MTDKGEMDEMWRSIISEYTSKRKAEKVEEVPMRIKPEMLTPAQIVEKLDESVIGQKKAKQLIAIAAFNRLLAMNNKALGRDTEEYFFEKNNILLIGGTGCGKTHTVRALADCLGLPVTIQDATTFTSAGYVGRDVEDAIAGLAVNAGKLVDEKYDTSSMRAPDRKKLVKQMAEYGIVYIDEADKVRAAMGGAGGKDVNGRSVQEAFLKMVEGTEVDIKEGYYGTLDTTNMLFIFGGAFAGVQELINLRTEVKSMGFNGALPNKEKKESVLKDVNIGDFTKFGMIPELMGRLPTVAVLEDLDEDMISRIFSEPRRSIMSQVINEFKTYGVKVSFTKDAIGHIVQEAMKLKLGARGLKSVSQQLLRPLFFHFPSLNIKDEVIITKDMLIEINREEY